MSKLTVFDDYVAAVQLMNEHHEVDDLFILASDPTFELLLMRNEFRDELSDDFAEMFTSDQCNRLASVYFSMLTGESTPDQIIMELHYLAMVKAAEKNAYKNRYSPEEIENSFGFLDSEMDRLNVININEDWEDNYPDWPEDIPF